MRDHCFEKGREAWPIDVPAEQPRTCPAKEWLNPGHATKRALGERSVLAL